MYSGVPGLPSALLLQGTFWSEVQVTQLCLTLCNPMDGSPPDSSVHEILQATILEWVAILFSRASFWPRDRTCVSCIAGEFITIWTKREAHRVSFTWEIYLSFRRSYVSQTVLLAPTLKYPNSKKSRCLSGIFGGDIFWIPTKVTNCFFCALVSSVILISSTWKNRAEWALNISLLGREVENLERYER